MAGGAGVRVSVRSAFGYEAYVNTAGSLTLTQDRPDGQQIVVLTKQEVEILLRQMAIMLDQLEDPYALQTNP